MTLNIFLTIQCFNGHITFRHQKMKVKSIGTCTSYDSNDNQSVKTGTLFPERYDTRQVPNNWMSDPETINKLNNIINVLEMNCTNQLELDSYYDSFIQIVHTEIDNKFEKRPHHSHINNKRRRIKNHGGLID